MSYFLTKVNTSFSSAHQIHGYDGPCARMHGHNWLVEVEVMATKLDDIGIGIDFKHIKKATNDIIDTIDHRCLNEIPPFTQINPTAENIAKWLYDQLKITLNNDDIKLSAVTLFETDNCSIRYSEGSLWVPLL